MAVSLRIQINQANSKVPPRPTSLTAISWPSPSAKRIIDSQLAFAPSCEELAKKVNISVSKLTKGFNSLFGTSVHAYIIDQRLEKAAGLLLESDLNVSQIATLVGYSKPSNFAAAFKKKYGVIPKNYKDENTIG